LDPRDALLPPLWGKVGMGGAAARALATSHETAECPTRGEEEHPSPRIVMLADTVRET
jgi:hypothetical protein